MNSFTTQIPFATRVAPKNKNFGSSLGPFVDQQIAASGPFLNQYISKLQDTNPIFPAKKYGSFQADIDLTTDPNSGQIVPATGKDPFIYSGNRYLKQFIADYDRGAQIGLVNDPVPPGGLTEIIQQKAEKPSQFPGADGTKIS